MKTRKPFVVPALAGILPFRLKAPKGGTTNDEIPTRLRFGFVP